MFDDCSAHRHGVGWCARPYGASQRAALQACLAFVRCLSAFAAPRRPFDRPTCLTYSGTSSVAKPGHTM